jgi:hypothetical protein
MNDSSKVLLRVQPVTGSGSSWIASGGNWTASEVCGGVRCSKTRYPRDMSIADRRAGPPCRLSPRAVQSTLSPMNWRRGLLLAGINVGIALPMMAILAARDAQLIHDRKPTSESGEASQIASLPGFSAPQSSDTQVHDEQTVSFSPCDFRGRPEVQESVVQAGNLPVAFATQWRLVCPSKWSIARMLGVNDSGLLSDANFRAMRRVDVALCFLIAIQWFIIGSFALIKARRWWSEPGAFVTLCTAIGSAIALIPVVDVFGRLPVLFAFFGWLWYFALLLWIPVHHAWQSTLRGLRRLS